MMVGWGRIRTSTGEDDAKKKKNNKKFCRNNQHQTTLTTTTTTTAVDNSSDNSINILNPKNKQESAISIEVSLFAQHHYVATAGRLCISTSNLVL
jgi:hypothetical protein